VYGALSALRVPLLPAHSAAPGPHGAYTQQPAAAGSFSAPRAPLLPSQGRCYPPRAR
jgi:hypothetical protein